MTSILPFTDLFSESDDVKIVSDVVNSIPFSAEIQSFLETKNPQFVADLSLDEVETLCKSFVYLGLDIPIGIFEEIFWHAARSSKNVFIRNKNNLTLEEFEWCGEDLQRNYFLWKCIEKDSNILLKLAVSQTDCTCTIAAKRGNLRLLEFLKTNRRPWDASTCASAALNGHLEILKWLRQNGCPWSTWTCAYAAQNGHLEVLRWARQKGCPWDTFTGAYAAANGHLDVLKWAWDNGFPWDTWTCANAAQNGHLEILKWLKQNGCPWDTITFKCAARNGHLEVLKWLRQNGCPWDTWTCANAASKGHLEVLKWLRQNFCPWDTWTCNYAARNGHLEVLKWLRQNGCPWDKGKCTMCKGSSKSSLTNMDMGTAWSEKIDVELKLSFLVWFLCIFIYKKIMISALISPREKTNMEQTPKIWIN